jgi:hypothetical protein
LNAFAGSLFQDPLDGFTELASGYCFLLFGTALGEAGAQHGSSFVVALFVDYGDSEFRPRKEMTLGW